MKQMVRVEIDRGVRPVSVVVESDHGFIHRDVIRRSAVRRLPIGLLYTVVDGRSVPVDAGKLKKPYSMGK